MVVEYNDAGEPINCDCGGDIRKFVRYSNAVVKGEWQGSKSDGNWREIETEFNNATKASYQCITCAKDLGTRVKDKRRSKKK